MGGATTSSTSTTSTSTSGSSSSGTSVVSTAVLAANAANPLDAVPDSAGTTIYFTAIDPTLGAQVFKVPADGSAPTPVAVSTGTNVLAAPIGLTISTDGTVLYVSDPGTINNGPPIADNRGAIYSVPSGGGGPTLIAGTTGYEIRGLDLAQVSGADTLYFTGTDTANGKKGVFSLPVTGGKPTVISEGSFGDPSGLAVATDGKIYVIDTLGAPPAGAGTQTAQVYSIDTTASNAVAPVGTPIAVGYPAGIAISLDQATLLISSHDPVKRTDVLFQIDIATPATTASFTSSVVTSTEAAGFHRASKAAVYAWVDTKAGTSGQVYTVK